MSGSIVVGEIDRISGSGNAMLRADNNEYNLGPLPRSTVGNPVVVVPLSGPWAVCLTPYIKKEKYLSKFASATGKSKSEVKEAIQNAGGTISNYFDSDLSPPPTAEFVEGHPLEVQIAASGEGASYVLFDDGSAIEIDVPFLPPGHETTIEIKDSDSPIRSATISESVLQDAPSAGTELTVEILGNTGSTAYGLYESTPVVLPDCPASKGDYVHAAVTSKSTKGVKATVSALPEEERLSVGDSFGLELNLSSDHDRTLVHEGTPIQILAPGLPIQGTVPITITDIESNSVTAEVDFSAQSITGIEVGQELSLNQLERHGNRLIGKHNGTPVTFSITNEPPTLPDSIDVIIDDISPEEISVTIKSHPRLKSLESGDIITVSIKDEENNYLIGDYRDFTVWIPFDGTITPSELTVAVSQLTDYGIFASVAELPEDAVPEAGQIVAAKIKEEYTSNATAWLEASDEVDRYSVPVFIPLKSEIQGRVGIEIVDKRDSHLVGIIRAESVGEDITPVSKYVLETQRATIALRNRSLTEAASAWESAAEATNSSLRELDAKRSESYSKAEEALENEKIEKAKEIIKELQKYLSEIDISKSKKSDFEDELDAYSQLITATQEKAPDSVTGLQQIAYNVNTRSMVNQAAAQVPQSSRSFDNSSYPVFPHPFFGDRLQHLCEQFDSVPDAARDVLDQLTALDETSWSIPPASTNEPRPTKTMDINPIIPDLSASSSGGEVTDDDSGSSKDESPSVTSETSPNSENTRTPSVDEDSTREESFSPKQATASSNSASRSSPSDESTVANPDGAKTPPLKDSGNLVVKKESPETPSPSKEIKNLRQEAEKAASKDPVRDTSDAGTGSRYQRAPEIREFVIARADGVCEACGEPAPFKDKNGDPYLESHHVDELGKGGEDHPAKVVALCPECHKRVHYGQNGDQLNDELREKLKNGLAQVGLD